MESLLFTFYFALESSKINLSHRKFNPALSNIFETMVFLDWVESSSNNNTASTVTKELFFATFSSPEDRMSYLYVFTPRNKASQRLSVAMAEWHVVTKSRACKLSRPTASSCHVTLSCRSEAKPWRDEGLQNGPLFSQCFFFAASWQRFL